MADNVFGLKRASNDLHSPDEEAWIRFLLTEGLDFLAAYRSIEDASVRAMFVRMMKETAQTGQNTKIN